MIGNVVIETVPARVEEFAVLWFDSTLRWHVLLDDGSHAVPPSCGCVGDALAFALKSLGAAKADFECVMDYGDFYRFRRCLEGSGR